MNETKTYTEEVYKQDLRLARYAYNKFFKNLRRYEEDLIQCALIALYENRSKYDSTYTYATWAVISSKFTMLKFLRKEKLKDTSGSYVHFTSLNAPASNECEEDRELADIIASEDEINYNFDYNYLQTKLKQCIEQKKKHKSINFERYSKIVNLCASTELNYSQVAKQVGVSKEYVRLVMKKFRQLFKQELINDNYLELGEYGK